MVNGDVIGYPVPTTVDEARAVLTERRNWLAARIAAKQSVGWDVDWDTREWAALCRILDSSDPRLERDGQ